MAACRQCGKSAGVFATLCDDCVAKNGAAAKALLDREFERRAQSGESLEPEPSPEKLEPDYEFTQVVISTETVAGFPIERRLGVVNGTCIFGQHVGRDIINMWTDFTGGRAKSAEALFAEARSFAMRDLRARAHSLGGDAVIAVTLDQRDLTGGGKSMIMVSVTGTAVKRSQEPDNSGQ